MAYALQDFLNGKGGFDVATAGDSHKCQLGIWLDNEGHRLIPSKLGDEIRATHNEFHQIASEIFKKIKEKRFAEVRADIAPEGALNQATGTLTSLLSKAKLLEPGATYVSVARSELPATSKEENPEP